MKMQHTNGIFDHEADHTINLVGWHAPFAMSRGGRITILNGLASRKCRIVPGSGL